MPVLMSEVSVPVMIQTVDLVKEFPMGSQRIFALNGVDLEIRPGEFVCVMGPSGSGKSTLLNLIGGLDRPTKGQIVVEGRDLATLDENALAAYRRRGVGFVFQTFNLIPTMTALHNVAFPMIFARVPASQRKVRAGELLTEMGLGDRLDHRPTELSGGEQQRVAMARALANDPDIILADEPTGNLDSRTGHEVMEVLARVNREERRTILVVSHDPEVAAFAGRVLRLLDGRILDGKG